MFLAKDRVGGTHFLFFLLLVMTVFLGTLAGYYLYAPAGVIQIASMLVILCVFAARDHVPIGMHGRLIYRWSIQEGSTAAPSNVPRWIARFAAEPDHLLVAGSLIGVVVNSVSFMICDLFMSEQLLSKSIADLGWMQLFFVPHLIGYTTWSLIGLRQELMGRIYKIACAERVPA